MAATTVNTCPDPKLAHRINQQLARFNLWPAKSGEILEARAFAVRLIGGQIADHQTLGQVHARSGAALFLTREQSLLTGALGLVLLSRSGLAAVEADRFDAAQPSLDHVARPSEPPEGVYVWGLAASTRRGALRVVAGARAVRQHAAPDLPCFGRAATLVGWRLMVDRLKCRPAPGSRTGLMVFGSPTARGAAA